MLTIGFDRFAELLAGAHAIDKYFRAAPFERNLPVVLAMLWGWHRNFLGAPTLAPLPHDQHLHRFAASCGAP